MKGVVFNLLEQAVTSEHGPDTWDDLLDATGLDGAYASVGQYPDEHMEALVAAASEKLGVSPADVLRWFGAAAMPMLRESYPSFFNQPDLRAFLLSLNKIIHAEVRKLYPGADVPNFDYEESGDDLVLIYRSARQLCPLAEGFITGAAAEFGQRVSITQPECMNEGAAACRIVCRFG